MRLMKVAATIGVAVAMAIGAAGTGSAAQNDYSSKDRIHAAPNKDNGASAQRTAGHSFWEINNAGELVYWTRSGGSFSREVRGWGWNGSRQITSLSADRFLEIKPGYQLSLWTWHGGGFTENIIGTGWQGARVITGITADKFLEIKQDGRLVRWVLSGLSLTEQPVGSGWGPTTTRTITGLGGPEAEEIDFIEVQADGPVSEWWNGEGFLKEYPFGTVNFADVRLVAGLDHNHFVFIPNDGSFWEFEVVEESGGFFWIATQKGSGWGGTRLIG